MNMRNVLVVAAHPDDEVLGSGGTIAKMAAAGEEVHVLIVTDGSSTQYPGDQVKRAQKKGELEACCRTLGVSVSGVVTFEDVV